MKMFWQDLLGSPTRLNNLNLLCSKKETGEIGFIQLEGLSLNHPSVDYHRGTWLKVSLFSLLLTFHFFSFISFHPFPSGSL